MNHPNEQFEAYIAGGLSPQERSLVEQHIAECGTCAAALARAQAADAAMNRIFAGEQPDNDFEERMIANLRRRQRRLVHPAVRKVAVGLAASLLLGGIGYAGSQAMEKGRLPLFASTGQGSGHGLLSAARSQRSPTTQPDWAAVDAFYTDGAMEPGAVTSVEHTFLAQRYSAAPSANLHTVGKAADAFGGGVAKPAFGSVVDNHYAYTGGLSDNVRSESAWSFNSGKASSKNMVDGLVGGLPKGDESGARGYLTTRNPVNNLSLASRRGALLDDPTVVKQAAVSERTELDQLHGEANKKIPHDYFDVAKANKNGEGDYRPSVDKSQYSMGYWDGHRFELATDDKSAAALDRAAGKGGANGKLDEAAKELKKATETKGTYLSNGDTTLLRSLVAATNAKDIRDSDDDAAHVQANVSLDVAGKSRATLADAGGGSGAGDGPAPKPNNGPVPAPATPPPDAAPAEQPPVDLSAKPKIIRTGEMEFEVGSFDDSVSTVSKIVTEESGYVSTVNSDKLPNGKVRGSIVLRVPAEHLDTLVLKLRGVGDLHSQHINAQDITKQFTDTDSALRAAKAMQERLLDIIKNGKGTVKDLLEAEKQLGVWREKVEQLEGEIRYFSNQVALSTLTLTLYEKDIRTPALASESETVTMALETEQVEDAYAKAKDAIAQAKGRIISSELKQYDAGQFGGTICAQVPPDAAEAVIGRLKQIEGRVAKFERQRSQTTSNGGNPVDAMAIADPIKVKREDVTINLTLYNLANVAPRRTTTMTLVAPDVEQTYRTLIDQVRTVGGRVITSQINRGKADEVAGVLNFTVPAEKADLLLNSVRGAGELLKTETAESADTQNVTESKRGFNLTLGSLSAFAARETQTIQFASVAVPESFNDLLNTLQERSARILTSRLNEQDMTDAGATLEFDLGRDSIGVFETQLAKDGQVVSRQVNRSTDTDNTVDSKIHIVLTIGASQQLPPRQTTEMSVETPDVQKAMDDLQAAALSAGGRQMDSPAISQGDNGQTTATMTLDVPMAQIQSLIDKADESGHRQTRRTSIDAHAPEGKLARARLTVTFATPATLAGNDDSIWAGVRRGLGTSLRGLSYSLTLIVIGLCLVVPWVLVIALGRYVVKWFKRGRVTTTQTA